MIAVASGRYDVDDFKTCHPDLVLADLMPVESIMSFMRNAGSFEDASFS